MPGNDFASIFGSTHTSSRKAAGPAPEAEAPSSPTDRRRSSGAQRFAKLHEMKRNPNDSDGAARRASYTDQMAKSGFLGTMWNNFTRGPSQGDSK